MNRNQSENHRIATYEINETSLLCSEQKITYPKQWIYGFLVIRALGYQIFLVKL